MITHQALLMICYVMLLPGLAYTWLMACFSSVRSANGMSAYHRSAWVWEEVHEDREAYYTQRAEVRMAGGQMTGQLGWSEAGSGCEGQWVSRKLRRAFTLTPMLAPLMAWTSSHLLESAASAKSCFKNTPKAKETNPPPPAHGFPPHGQWAWPLQCLPCRAPKHGLCLKLSLGLQGSHFSLTSITNRFYQLVLRMPARS